MNVRRNLIGIFYVVTILLLISFAKPNINLDTTYLNNHWVELPITAPTTMQGYAMAYDEIKEVIILSEK